MHDGLFGMAAAYLFHIVSNGISISHPSDALYELTIGVAEGRTTKNTVAAVLEQIAKSRR